MTKEALVMFTEWATSHTKEEQGKLAIAILLAEEKGEAIDKDTAKEIIKVTEKIIK